MKFHIVGNGESVEDILRGYDITISELKNENKHIRVWNYLIPGTKLKIPVLTESIVEEINEIEPFIEDYYPKITIEDEYQDIEQSVDENLNNTTENITFENELMEDKKEKNEIVEEIKENKIEEVIENNQINNNFREYNQPQLYRYVYPQLYYYRPVIYVIPRRK